MCNRVRGQRMSGPHLIRAWRHGHMQERPQCTRVSQFGNYGVSQQFPSNVYKLGNLVHFLAWKLLGNSIVSKLRNSCALRCFLLWCGVVGDGVHMWCGGRWCAHVVWWEMVCTCGVVGDGVHMWCGGRWCAHVVWSTLTQTCTPIA